ncbi:SH3 domain-containing protein [Candidatus Contubernalis alkaliaceticus]|uniref:SH3 domain-containing protein n=1 Tax=Candidatus Contubernalis alkaliaceticus TaxID=338645 RepID=UPI001F4C1E72|nr:SH3 domain-containing protein [Candidatus Contubernalis alkalaceticus]UNC91594.1 SH3 domain-containing protein [Candidatus Contubernalis alkalaceticus]
MRLFLYVLLIILLIFPLSGCGKDNGEELDYSLVDVEGEESEQSPEGNEVDLDSEELTLNDLFDPVYITVTGSSVYLREGPGTSFDVVGSTQNGDQLEVVFFMEHWISIKTQDGQEGFIAGWLTDAQLPQPDSESLLEEKLEVVP